MQIQQAWPVRTVPTLHRSETKVTKVCLYLSLILSLQFSSLTGRNMKSTVHLGILLVCLIVFATLTAVSGRLKCYQCKVEANSLCTDDYLLPCPDNQAYDTCMTTIEQTKSRFTITKTCALGPCNLLDSKQRTGLGLDHCDRSSSEYSCVHCCRDDGCNKDGADSVHPSLVMIFILLFLITIVFLSSG